MNDLNTLLTAFIVMFLCWLVLTWSVVFMLQIDVHFHFLDISLLESSTQKKVRLFKLIFI